MQRNMTEIEGCYGDLQTRELVHYLPRAAEFRDHAIPQYYGSHNEHYNTLSQF
jgi:hypothetical protein